MDLFHARYAELCNIYCCSDAKSHAISPAKYLSISVALIKQNPEVAQQVPSVYNYPIQC